MVFRNLNSVSIVRFVFLMVLFSAAVTRAAVDPKTYASIYAGLIRSINNDLAEKNYHDILKEVQTAGQVNDSLVGDKLSIVRLPVFRVPVLKVIVAEMQRRKLITEAELEMAQKLIEEKEELMSKGGGEGTR